jgi:hypothetical protein
MRCASALAVALPCASAFVSPGHLAVPKLSSVSSSVSLLHRQHAHSVMIPTSTIQRSRNRALTPVMSSDAAPSAKSLDTGLMAKWFGATVLQVSLIFLFMAGLDNVGPKAFEFVGSQSPAIAKASPVLGKAFASIFFLFMSLRSRVFSPLDNSRPTPPKNRSGRLLPPNLFYRPATLVPV